MFINTNLKIITVMPIFFFQCLLNTTHGGLWACWCGGSLKFYSSRILISCEWQTWAMKTFIDVCRAEKCTCTFRELQQRVEARGLKLMYQWISYFERSSGVFCYTWIPSCLLSTSVLYINFSVTYQLQCLLSIIMSSINSNLSIHIYLDILLC